MVQTRLPAKIGGPPPAPARHRIVRRGGELETASATGPDRHGRNTVEPRTAGPPVTIESHTLWIVTSWWLMPPRWAPLSRYALSDFPDATTLPLPSNAGAVERSASLALSVAQVPGAKYWIRCIVGVS